MSQACRRSSALKVVVWWRHLCLTAPSRCNGHPTGISESSRHPSLFCSITVPKRGTSIVVFRCHVSGARRPRFATSARASNLGWSLRGKRSPLMMRRSPCMGSAAVLATVSSSNQVGRKDLTPMAVLKLQHLISSWRRLWYTGGTIQAGRNTFT